MGSLWRLFTMEGWREGSVTDQWKRLWEQLVRRVTTSSFCLCIASSSSSCVFLIQYWLVGIRLATIWNFRGQAFKAGTSILSIRNFAPRLLFTLLHSVWRPESEEAGAQFYLCIVLGCGWRKGHANAVCFALSAKKRIDSCMGCIN